ncbi:LLM class flavin-dependent oxidoreductase [Micromonospora sp. NBS 11-29]|uniref:LLM class flavin-dependent oxidoreductase n=1 Tax=Micromonospora sp. NBS 11-29 TaxID=1960879 RepID=UPI000B77CDCC|nr:LLM class flavin-dependent oxidoreductase [Micromonospora sp. NBS 11-29]
MNADRRTAEGPLLFAAVTPGDGAGDLARVRGLVQACERTGFHAAVLREGTARNPGPFESTTLAAALAVVTTHIGLVAGVRAGGLAPYHLARIAASLDHLTAGRCGLELHTGDGPDAGVAETTECLDVVRGLWDSFDDDAFVHDRAQGLYWRLERMHRLDHTGRHHRVAGPLNVARPPQGHPVVVVTDPRLAASADVVFLDPVDLPEARSRREELRREAAAAGRDPDQLKVCAPLPAGAGVDQVTEWTQRQATDGFLVPVTRADDPFLVTVGPELVRRGLAGGGGTLRGRLGLARPGSRFATARR